MSTPSPTTPTSYEAQLVILHALLSAGWNPSEALLESEVLAGAFLADDKDGTTI